MIFMKITYSVGKNNKIHISADGEYKFTVDADYWFFLGLHSGDELSEREFEELRDKVGVRRAYNKGLDFLSRRAHSKKELFNKIKRTSEEKYVIIALKRLEEKGYVDDEDFSLRYYEYLKTVKHFGRNRIKSEFYKKGLDSALLDIAESEVGASDNGDIRDIIDRKYIRFMDDEKGRRKVFNALVRMGYDFSDIRTVMNEYNYLSED